eukprot:TRINITY_DN45542_c0_g1_i2.p1 TRINITY_DN45542_c0_g1~~TRINITY_DN45542_c0_g1_i2.p1  ORF type:complete len:102 (+),score=3.07 TRINITY_DN45542_c0_g1_i2:165-470(+)
MQLSRCIRYTSITSNRVRISALHDLDTSNLMIKCRVKCKVFCHHLLKPLQLALDPMLSVSHSLQLSRYPCRKLSELILARLLSVRQELLLGCQLSQLGRHA